MSKNNFIDRFSGKSDVYSTVRPKYPDELYEFLAENTPDRKIAWDCATGNGQAAIALARYFEQVYATDASSEQIASAQSCENITYQVATAESSPLASASADLVTAATAAHWFDLEKFYAEVKRVLKPNGVLAMWAYGSFVADSKPVNQIMKTLGREILGEYWDDNLHSVWSGYDKLPFPFEEIEHAPWTIHTDWTRNDLISFMSTWSAAQRYMDKHVVSPVDLITDELVSVWPEEQKKHCFSAVLTSRLGRSV